MLAISRIVGDVGHLKTMGELTKRKMIRPAVKYQVTCHFCSGLHDDQSNGSLQKRAEHSTYYSTLLQEPKAWTTHSPLGKNLHLCASALLTTFYHLFRQVSIVYNRNQSMAMAEDEVTQADATSINGADYSGTHTDQEVIEPADTAGTSGESFNAVLSGVWCKFFLLRIPRHDSYAKEPFQLLRSSRSSRTSCQPCGLILAMTT